MSCLLKCQSLNDQYCQIAKFGGEVSGDGSKTSRCDIYKARCLKKDFDLIENRTVNSTNIYINRNFGLCYKLVNYWNFNKNLKDTIGNADLTLTTAGSLKYVQDRHGNNDSALYVFQQSFALPNGVYIDGEFTLAVWIKVITQYNLIRLLSVFSNYDWTALGKSLLFYFTIFLLF